MYLSGRRYRISASSLWSIQEAGQTTAAPEFSAWAPILHHSIKYVGRVESGEPAESHRLPDIIKSLPQIFNQIVGIFDTD